jgi:hypothetical protein
LESPGEEACKAKDSEKNLMIRMIDLVIRAMIIMLFAILASIMKLALCMYQQCINNEPPEQEKKPSDIQRDHEKWSIGRVTGITRDQELRR